MPCKGFGIMGPVLLRMNSMTGNGERPEAAKDFTAAAFAKASQNLDGFRWQTPLFRCVHVNAAIEPRSGSLVVAFDES